MSETASEGPPAEAVPGTAAELEALLLSFARVEGIADPVRRHFEMLREAEGSGLGFEGYSNLFGSYLVSRRAPRRSIDASIARLVAWLDGFTLFSLLQYIGRLGLLVAIVSFIVEYPKRQLQWRYQTWQTVESASGKVYNRSRVQALEALNGACVSLEGAQARHAAMAGLALDRCYGVPGGGLFGRWLPGLFRRRGADLLGADLAQASLTRARLPLAILRDANLTGTRLGDADLTGADLRGANLAHADLFYAHLAGADLTGADLTGANLSHADLSGADLTQARLGGAYLVWAKLHGARLLYADLERANLARADLHRADLYRTRLAGAVLRKARIDQRTGLDGADLTGADLRGAALGSADPIRSAAHWERALFNPGVRSAVPGPQPHRRLMLGLLIEDEQYFYKEIERGARRAAAEAGAQLMVRVVDTATAQGMEHEAALLRELIGAGVDALLVVPQDEIRSVPALRQAWEAGVALVSYDQALNARDAARYISNHYASSHRVLGYETGRYLAGWLQQGDRMRSWGRVGIFRSCEFSRCYERAQGFRRALDDAGVPWREVAYRSLGTGEPVAAAATEILTRHPDIQILWAANEEGTERAVTAVRALGLAGRVRVLGTDISPTLEKMLGDRDGILLAVTAQQPEEMGYRAASAALAALRGEDVRGRKDGVIGHRRYVRKGER